MAISPIPQAPFRQDRKVFLTPIIGDVLFSEVRDCSRITFPEYGTYHPDTKKWPNHKLVFIKSVDIERDGLFEFFYAADRKNQDLYNFSFDTRSLGSREFRVVVREYITPRSEFDPLYSGFNAPMPDVPEGVFDGVEYVFFEKMQKRIEEPELDSLYVSETVTYIEKDFLDKTLSFTSQKPDLIPQKFRSATPDVTTEGLEVGDAELPTLGPLDLQVSQRQINPNVKLVSSATQSAVTLPVTLSLGKQVDGEGVLVDITETLAGGAQTITPSATVSGQVDDLGNGLTVKTTQTKAEVFSASSFSKETPDTTPTKFRTAVPTTTTQSTSAGTAAMPTLGVGELAKSEQQQTKFVKRTQVTARDVASLPVSLTQVATDNNKQVAEITETLQVGDTADVPTATLSVESEALGDGTYLVRTVETPVFGAEAFSVEKPELIPTAFRGALPTTTTSEIVEGAATLPTLAAGEQGASEQQVDAFLKRVSLTTRDTASLPVSLTESAINRDGIVDTIVKTLNSTPQTITPSATVSGQVDALGDGLTLKTEVTSAEVFAAPSFSLEKPDLIPTKFRAALPTTTTQQTVVGTAAAPTLGANDLAKTESQQTKFTKRVQTTTRPNPSATSFSGKEVFSQYGGGVATTTESLVNDGVTPTGGLNVLSHSVTPLGNGKSIESKVETTEQFPELSGQNYDAELGFSLPFTQKVVAAGTVASADTDVSPIDQWRSLHKITDKTTIQAELAATHLTFPTQDTVSLPDTLMSVEVLATRVVSNGDARTWGSTRSSTIESAVAVSANLSYTIKEGYRGPVPAEVHVFFLPKTGATPTAILDTVGALAMPIYQPVSTRAVVTGTGMNRRLSQSQGNSGGSASESSDVQAFTNVANVPPCLSSGVPINIVYSDYVSDTTLVDAQIDAIVARGQARVAFMQAAVDSGQGSVFGLSMSSPTNQAAVTNFLAGVSDLYSFASDLTPSDGTVSVSPTSIPATNPPALVAGRYLKNSNVTLYGHDMVKVTAVVVDLTGII
jgi:hypothetical protein